MEVELDELEKLITNTRIFVKVKPGHSGLAWSLRTHVLPVLSQLKVRDITCKLAVEDAPWRQPIRMHTGFGKALLIKRYSLSPAAIKGDYKKTVTTLCSLQGGPKPIPMISWFEQELGDPH